MVLMYGLFTGIQLDIFLRNELLIQEVTVPEEYMGLTKGLLGNFDGNPDNDFVFQNGDVLTQNASERYIFQFGQSCKLHLITSQFLLSM